MVSSTLETFFETKTTLKQLPHVLAEWNLNRYADEVTAYNNTKAKFDEIFPIDSVIKPNRPDTGISFAFPNRAQSSSSSNMRSRYGSNQYSDRGLYITPGENMPYTYWISPYSSVQGGRITNCSPTIEYDRAYKANKILAKFEVSWGFPEAVSVWIKRPSGQWVRIATNLSQSNGRIELYYNGSGWTQAETYGPMTDVAGVRLVVSYMNQAKVYAHVIEIAALRVEDISNDIIRFSGSSNREELSERSPIGISSSNEFDMSLDNSSGRYSPSNELSDLHGLLDDNIKLYVWVEHEHYSTELEKLGEFYTESWPDSDSGVISVRASDFIRQLQEFASTEILMSQVTPEFAIRTLLGAYGYSNITFRTESWQYKKIVLPYVWSKAENSLWETINEVLRAAQAALYIDENGDFIYETKEWFFNRTNPAAYLEIDESNGIKPNIIRWETENEITANAINVNYSPLVENNDFGLPVNSILWQPNEAIALASSPLRYSMTATQKNFIITRDVAMYFPYEGRVNIEGETIAFKGKEYQYYKNGGTLRTIVRSHEEKRAIDADSDPRYSYLNIFTGKIIVTERGWGDSKAEPHTVGMHGAWSSRRWGRTGRTHYYEDGRQLVDGRARLKQWTYSDYNTYHTMTRGVYSDSYAIYGTKLRLVDRPMREGIAGICFFIGNDNKSGLFVELLSNDYVSNVRKNSIGNVRCYRINSDQSKQGLPNDPAGLRGYDWNIEKNRDYKLEIMFNRKGRIFSVFIDGLFVTSFTDNYPNPRVGGKWGVFVRGYTWADFEYFYYMDESSVVSPEQEAIHKQIIGGYTSQFLENRIHERNHKLYFMEFAPVVHEIRDFEVDHSVEPALSSDIYLSNNDNAMLIDHRSTPFKTNFTVVNTSRNLAVLNGNDVTSIPGEDVDQQMFAFGMAIILDEQKSINVKNESSIRRHGKVEVDFTNSWVQTESHAQDIADYIEEYWSNPVEIVRAEVILPPGLKVSDLVNVNIADKGIVERKYAVVGIDYRFEGGMRADLTLMSFKV